MSWLSCRWLKKKLVGFVQNQTLEGEDGGYVTLSMTGNENTGDFSASCEFKDFCEDGITMTGSLSMSGRIDLETEEPLYFTLSFNPLTLNDGMESFTISGNIHYNFQVYPNRLDWAFDFEQWQLRNYDFNEYVELSTALAKANWASILSIVIVFILVTYVHWNLINSYVDRNFCEEVTK